MSGKPLATRKKRRLDGLFAQKIDDLAVVTGDFATCLAEIEREGDEFRSNRQSDPADGALDRCGASRINSSAEWDCHFASMRIRPRRAFERARHEMLHRKA